MIGFTDIGSMGGTEPFVTLTSGDGNVIVGHVVAPSGRLELFRWTTKEGLSSLGSFGGISAEATAISQDGSAIAGYFTDGKETAGHRLFRWTVEVGFQDLGPIDTSLTALSMSPDGNVITGWKRATHNRHDEQVDIPDQFHVFQWKAGSGITDLGFIGGRKSEVIAISADQKVFFGVVGGSSGAKGQYLFRWSRETGLEYLFELGALYERGSASLHGLFVSSDGTVAAGSLVKQPKNNVYDSFVFRWTRESGLQNLGVGQDSLVYLNGMSPDGKIVVGKRYLGHGKYMDFEVFRWVADGGLQTLPELNGSHVEIQRLSLDGQSIITESMTEEGKWRLERWTNGHGVDLLGLESQPSVLSWGVSLDGRAIAGPFFTSDCKEHIFRWTSPIPAP